MDIPSIPGWGPVVLPNLALSYVACCAPVQGRDEIEGSLELGVCELDNHMMSTIIITPDIFMYQDVSNMPWSTIPRNMSPALCLSMCVTSLQRVSLKQQNEWVSEGCTSKFNSPGECQMTLDLLVTSHKGLLQTSKENQLQKKVFRLLKKMGPCKKDYFRWVETPSFWGQKSSRNTTLESFWILLQSFAFSSDQSYFLITWHVETISQTHRTSRQTILPCLFNGR